MTYKWKKYIHGLANSILKSIGVQGVSWGGINGLHATGMDVPMLNLKMLGWMLLFGAIMPAVFKYWEQTSLLEPEFLMQEQTVTQRDGDKSMTTKTKTVTRNPADTPEPHNPEKPKE